MRKNVNSYIFDASDYRKELKAYNKIGKNGCLTQSEWKKKVRNGLPDTIDELEEVRNFFVRRERGVIFFEGFIDRIVNPIYMTMLTFFITLTVLFVEKWGLDVNWAVVTVGIVCIMVTIILYIFLRQYKKELYFCNEYMIIIQKKIKRKKKNKDK